MRRYRLTIAALCTLVMQTVWAGPVQVTDKSTTGAMPIVTTAQVATLVYDEADAPVVHTVSKMVQGDIQAVTGRQVPVSTATTGAPYAIIAGTVGQSKFIDGLATAGKIDVGTIRGKWESYVLQLVTSPYDGVSKALVVAGSNPRGTAYGLLELSRQLGVSPYVWWADVTPRHRDEIYVSGDRTEQGEPSVKYRGIFINDEDWGILPWARKTIDAAYNNIGPNTYERVAQLLLRLRANTLWPAKHGATKAFWTLEGNLKVARDYALVMSSGDPMLRDNLWEWVRFGGSSKNYNYNTNKSMMLDYWAKRVGQSRGYEAIYDISTRGFQDEPLLGYGSTAEAVKGITGLIADQRQLLTDSLGDATQVPQIYLPYKEALDLYNAGLKIPDDVTLCWVDDNFGYIRQLPTKAEQARSGGNGVYYHLSYLGTPASYLWLSSMSPAFLSYELTKGYENGIQRFWMFNVGDIKPAEMELEFCMDLAWDINAWSKDAQRYNRYWGGKTFGDDYADAIGSIKQEYYDLASVCKPELINRMDWPDNECNERIRRYDELVRKVDALKSQIPADMQDAYFELIEYPVKGAAAMNTKILRAQQAWFHAEAGHRDTTLTFAAASRNAYRTILSLTDKFNKQIANGKWNGMMNYKPYGGSVFDMPIVPTAEDVNVVSKPVINPDRTYYPARDYASVKGDIVPMTNVGVAGSCIAVWPMDETKYTASTYSRAPHTYYKVRVKAGLNTVVVRCLPTFPINSSYDLRVGIKMGTQGLVIKSVKTKAMSGKWNTTVAEGFSDATIKYTAKTDGVVGLTLYFMDPGLAVSDIMVESEGTPDNELTNALLVNPDFELNADGKHAGAKGVPYGWHMNVLPTGGSYGVNADAANPHGEYCCWVIARPFPDDFSLYQTIPADKIKPGIYRVSCMLWNQNGISGNCRLFANKNVQYFASPEGVNNILTDGEYNSYASYQGTTTADATMKPMSVYVVVNEGESLQLGIKSSNRKNNGTTASGNDPTGWFKVDNFRIERVGDLGDVAKTDDSYTADRIVNYDFELGADGIVNRPPNASKGVPYGWAISGDFPGTSYGINQAATNLHGDNVCWFQPQRSPIPEGFELSQTIPAAKLGAGRYRIGCKLYVESGYLGTCRLFANNSVQYYGAEADYEANRTEGEANTFAAYDGGTYGKYVLQDMFVFADVADGQDLTIGIRTSGQKGDGTYVTGSNRTGWFKVDYFTIERVSSVATGIDGITTTAPTRATGVYNLNGQRVADSLSPGRRLPSGIYIVNGKKIVVR